MAALEGLTDQEALVDVALRDEDYDVRHVAIRRITDQASLAKVTSESDHKDVRLAAVKRLLDQEALAITAIREKDNDVGSAALKNLTNQEAIAKVAERGENWRVRKSAFESLSEASLDDLALHAVDSATRIAARVQSGSETWESAIAGSWRNPNGMGDVLTAMALVPRQDNVESTVTRACHDYIRQGDDGRIAVLIELLYSYGDKPLAEDYINCGQSSLSSAGKGWARLNGYYIMQGGGSHRVQWGSDRRR